MSDHLTLYIAHYGGPYTWLRRRDGLPDELGTGSTADLAEQFGGGNINARLIIGGPQVVVRRLSYLEAEKRHLRRLMPFQLEEEVIGDISQFHFALGAATDGEVSLAYTEKARLLDIFTQLAEMGIEVNQCLPAALLPKLAPRLLASEALADVTVEQDVWALHWQDNLVSVRYGAGTGFTVSSASLSAALTMLLNAENRIDKLPQLNLSAPDENQLAQLEAALPSALEGAKNESHIAGIWDHEPDSDCVDLCQGEFSQRLPIERWWRSWQLVSYAAAAALVVYVAVLLLSLSQLKTENLEVRREIEQVFRTVVANGPANDPERRLRIMASDLTPKSQSGQTVALLAAVLPELDSRDDITLKGVYFTAEAGDLSLNVQASTFNAIESLRGALEGGGLSAELLSANAQGDNHSARLKVKRNQL
ncbi:type II secretion system protein GspL [Gilvimarinus polysaccharolyticus]|uniref:type II secretion system protein GspL n=1 Tax=Gilvimarinus polysaccharolyticus TaxID=863921 RepID=UPI000673B834|nr:type II secretion system protein GspL [Gilvimarinus polysaccharolyticus]